MTSEQRIAPDSIHPVKLTARDYWLLAESGAFEQYAKTELIEGEIWALNSVWRWHSRTNAAMIIELASALKRAGLDLTIHGPGSIAMSEHNVPEPDLSVTAPEPSANEPISLAAVKLAVELSDTTRKMDLGRKARLYAQHGVPEYWVADRKKQELVRHSDPGIEGYARIERSPFGTRVFSATLPGVIVETACLRD